MRISSSFRPAFLVLILCGPAFAWAQNDADKVYDVDIQSEDLPGALMELARELEVSIFFAKEAVQGQSIEPIRGRYTLAEVLKILLTDVCLRYERVRPTLVAISPGCEQPENAPATALASAAVQPNALAAPDLVEEIVVSERYLTGSRLRNPAFGQSMPLDIIDATEIRLSGYQAVGELLRYVPAVSGNSTSTLISNGGDGTATVTLRGLPASNTLVLLNGRRMNSDALQGSSVDLNTLPLAMVEQIEILKDGASAIYGSDAVAGVVNVITKQNVNGLILDAYAGRSAEGDLDTQNLSVVFGDEGARWTFTAGLNHYDQSGISSHERSLSASSDDRRRGGIDKRSSATSPARITLDSGAVILAAANLGTSPADFRPVNEDDRFEYRAFTTSIVPSERTSAFTHATWDFNDLWQGYLEGLYTSTEATNRLAPTPIFTAFETIPLTIGATQAFNPFGIELEDVRRRLLELPARRQSNESDTLRAIAGLRRETNGFNFEFAVQFNATDAQERNSNGVNAYRVAEALGDACVAPCVPLNLFGPIGSIDADMLNFITTPARTTGTSKMLAITIDSDWLWRSSLLGDIEISSGFEYRRDELNTSPDEVLRSGALLAGGNRSAISGDRDIFEAYAEMLLPLARNTAYAERIDLQLAARFSHYNDFGQKLNPRLVLSWVPIPELTLRTSMARGFRAPTLLQLYGSGQQSFQQLNDPCSIAGNVNTFAGCSVQSDPSLTQFLTVIGGDKDLDPERSETFSIGALWESQWAETQFAFSVDWFNIEQEDVVESSAQFIVNQNARFGRFDTRISRNVDGNLDGVLATLQNIGRRQVSGYDFTASLVHDFEKYGRVTLALNATHIARFEDKFDPSSPTIDKAGTFSDEASGGLGALPDWKWNTGISWQHTHWQGHYNIYRVSELTETIPLLETRRTIEAWTTHNANMSYLGPNTRWIRVTLGMNNLFDEAPPFSAAAFNDSYDARTYDITGRYYFVKLDKTI